jgi:ketosteroid isomerase-like protein
MRKPAAMSIPNEVIDRYVAAMRSGDYETGFGFFAEDVVFRVPGRSEWAGEHRGRDAAVAYIRNALEMAHQGEVELELIDRLTSDERVALLVRERFKRPEGDIVIRRANVYRIRGEEIAEVWIFEGDQYEVDALLGS